jgi:hypothetical protein
LDVHPPNRPIHTWKDFFLHLLTITIGLFIALTLEAAVQSMHHRHQVRDARAALRREITSNQTLYAENAARLKTNRAQLARDIDVLRDLRDNKKPDQPRLSWGWEWNSYEGTAWRTARDSGAVSYMDPGVISKYADIYLQQDFINTTMVGIGNEESRVGAALEVATDPAKLLPAEIEAMLIKSAEIDESIITIQLLMTPLEEMYNNALKQDR